MDPARAEATVETVPAPGVAGTVAKVGMEVPAVRMAVPEGMVEVVVLIRTLQVPAATADTVAMHMGTAMEAKAAPEEPVGTPAITLPVDPTVGKVAREAMEAKPRAPEMEATEVMAARGGVALMPTAATAGRGATGEARRMVRLAMEVMEVQVETHPMGAAATAAMEVPVAMARTRETEGKVAKREKIPISTTANRERTVRTGRIRRTLPGRHLIG